ncbi:MAG: hypothetical protein JJT75_04650 [Opitutales bacterium]|nr:hypothetical protein [Opitutales bacterium]MCH8540436.1 hypothetical protein [Opitutales bacterium]
MTEKPSPNKPSPEIVAFQQAQKSNRKARRIVLLLVLLPVVLFVLLGYQRIVNFIERDSPKLVAQVSAELAEGPYLANLQNALRDAFEELLPAYQTAFAEMIERDTELWEQTAREEYLKTEAYAQEVFPHIEDALREMLENQEELLRNELSKYIDSAQLDNFSESLLDALEAEMVRYYTERVLLRWENLTENIVDQLFALSEQEKTLDTENMPVLLGMILELIGLELQEHGLAATEL